MDGPLREESTEDMLSCRLEMDDSSEEDCCCCCC